MSNATAVKSADFETEVLKSSVPVLVDFWATWCGPCKMIAPHIDALATEYAGRARVYKVNVDEEQQIASDYGVTSIPSLLFFKEGKLVDRIVGAYPKQTIASHLEKLL